MRKIPVNMCRLVKIIQEQIVLVCYLHGKIYLFTYHSSK